MLHSQAFYITCRDRQSQYVALPMCSPSPKSTLSRCTSDPITCQYVAHRFSTCTVWNTKEEERSGEWYGQWSKNLLFEHIHPSGRLLKGCPFPSGLLARKQMGSAFSRR